MKRYDDNLPLEAEEILDPREPIKKVKLVFYDDENDEQYEEE